MSILLVGLPSELGLVLADRLISAGDEVRVLMPEPEGAEPYKARGVHVAVGPTDDDDLVERAATNVRTVVLGPEVTDVGAVLRGAEAATVDRIVACIPRPAPRLMTALHDSRLDHIVLISGKQSLLRRSSVPLPALAEAIDAADDLAGEPRAELDLTDPEAWRALRLEAPGRSEA